ncbi:hypothetical protein HJC23_011084 [Cyclotella cryptica]|uniref:NAD(P)-binding domain-containing protein n=1 Tax=Cyclotella cryptica TaxID=29204 RepID=A0ABD3NY63_9STRA
MVPTFRFLIASFLLVIILSPTFAFSNRRHRCEISKPSIPTTKLSAVHHDDNIVTTHHATTSPVINRRKWLYTQSALVSSSFLGTRAYADGTPTESNGDAVIPRKVSTENSVIILGANGGTGRECVSAVLASGRPCYATTRSGSFHYYDYENESSPLRRTNPKLHEDEADVTSLDGLLALVDKINVGAPESSVGAIIFAASASAKGKTPGVNDAFSVDYQGVINAARCCIQRDIPRLVVVSSGAVTRPNSAVYKLLNFVGNGIMEAKIRGEDEVRELYRNRGVIEKGLGYTIVRPGGLTNDPLPLGPSYLEVNQGDDKSGRLSRADVAAICVASLDIDSCWDTTFECYLKDTAKPVDNVGLSNILRLTDPTSYKSGREGTGETWNELLGGLKRDFTA